MARPRTVSDEAILEAARAVFLEEGSTASTQIVADRLGVSQAALFKRFGTKKALLLGALSPPAVPDFVPLLDQGPDLQRCPREQLTEIGVAVCRFFEMLLPRLMALHSAGFDTHEILTRYEVPPPLLALQAMSAWLERASGAGLIRVGASRGLAQAFLGSLHMRAFSAHLAGIRGSEDDLVRDVHELVSTLWFGIAPSSSEAS